MTLNETYCDLIDNDNGFDNQLLANRCEKISENNSIEFGKWLNNQVTNQNGSHHHLLGNVYVSDLYLIYKRVKGL